MLPLVEGVMVDYHTKKKKINRLVEGIMVNYHTKKKNITQVMCLR